MIDSLLESLPVMQTSNCIIFQYITLTLNICTN